MALKVGEKQIGTSIASLSQRQGITKAYNGNPISTAAAEISDTFSVLQKRAAELLDVEYRAKATGDYVKKFTEYSRSETYRADPDLFMKSAESYMNESINQAPTRYKGWTKALLNNLMASTGDEIWSRWNNNKQKEMKEKFEVSNKLSMEFIRNTILNKPIDQLDEYILGADGNGGLALQLVAEQYEEYTKNYYSLDPQYRASMLMPEEWFNQQKLAIEGFRMESVVMQALEQASAQDLYNYYNNPEGLEYKIEDLKFTETYKNLQSMLQTYVDDPTKIKSDTHKSSILANTDQYERSQIAEFILQKMQGVKAKAEAAHAQYGVFQEMNKQEYLNSIDSQINGFHYNILNADDNALANDLFNKGLDKSQIIQIVNNKNSNAIIYNEATKISSENPLLNTNLNNMSVTLMSKLKDLGTYSDADEVKQAIVDAAYTQQFRPVVEHEILAPVGPPQLGYTAMTKIQDVPEFFDINAVDLFEVNPADGSLVYQDKLNAANKIISVYNVIPTAVKHAFSNDQYLNIQSQNDFETALALGKMANAIANRGYYPSDLTEKDIEKIDNWNEFYKTYNSLDLSPENADKYLPTIEKTLMAMHLNITDDAYSSIVTHFDQVFTFDYFNENENLINIADFMFYEKNLDKSGKSVMQNLIRSAFGDREYGVHEINAIALTMKESFYSILAHDVYLDLVKRGVNPENLTQGTVTIPSKFYETEYLFKTIDRAMIIMGSKKLGFN